MPQVDAVKTPATLAEVAGAMARAYEIVRGRPAPSETSYLIPTAQSAFETGNWKSMYGWDSGNLTSTHPNTEPWDYQYQGSLKFKVYDSLDEGVLDQMRLLQKMGALDAADTGDTDAFVDALRRGHYIGNDDAAYRALANTLPRLLAQYRGVAPAPSTSRPPWLLALSLVGGAAAIAYAVRR